MSKTSLCMEGEVYGKLLKIFVTVHEEGLSFEGDIKVIKIYDKS
jgi:hypothetical protein